MFPFGLSSQATKEQQQTTRTMAGASYPARPFKATGTCFRSPAHVGASLILLGEMMSSSIIGHARDELNVLKARTTSDNSGKCFLSRSEKKHKQTNIAHWDEQTPKILFLNISFYFYCNNKYVKYVQFDLGLVHSPLLNEHKRT